MKNDSLEHIQSQERLLDQQLEESVYEEKKLRHLQEENEEFFFKTNQVFDGVLEQFSQNQFAWYLEDQLAGLRHDHQRLQFAFEEEFQEQKQQRQSIEEQQNDLVFERVRLQSQVEKMEVQP